MRASYKKLAAVAVVSLLLIAGAVIVTEKEWYEPKEEAVLGVSMTEEPSASDTEKKSDTSKGEQLIFWYEDESYTPYIEMALESFEKDTGCSVTVKYIDSLDYTGDIYDATMENKQFPDIYMLSGEQLEEVYLYGLAAENNSIGLYENAVAANALAASTYQEKLLGYPLSYNVCLFLYQKDYFEKAPESIQSIITYSDENEPPENVEYLLEWDVNDPFYDFPFVSNSITFVKEEAETMEIHYEESLYNEDLLFFEDMLESFSVDADTISEESIIENFKSGKTLCAILDSDALCRLEGVECVITEIPKLNDVLTAHSCALTDMMIINPYSENREKAALLAEYLTIDMSKELHALTGHYPVKISESPDEKERIVYKAYENAVLAPDSQDAGEFWLTLKETIASFFEQ